MKNLRTGCCGSFGQMAPAVLFTLTALGGSAQADPIEYDTFVQVNIYYGMSQLYSPTDVLLSTTVDMTVETQFPFADTVATVGVAFTPYFMPLMDQVVVDQLPGYTPLVPTYITDNLASFENSNGFGAADDTATSLYPPDPDTSPSPSALDLYAALTTQPVPFAVTSDTGFVEFGAMFDYVFGYGPFGPVPGTTADTIAGTTNVDIFERDIQLQETVAAVPEPRSIGLLGVVMALTLLKFYRRALAAFRPRP